MGMRITRLRRLAAWEVRAVSDPTRFVSGMCGPLESLDPTAMLYIGVLVQSQ